MRERTEELRKWRAEQRSALAAAKRYQQKLESCEELRQSRSKRLTLEAKHSNRLQIAEKERKRAELEFETDFYHRLMLDEVKADKCKEEESARRRFNMEQETSSVLARQMQEKLSYEEEERRKFQVEEAEKLKEIMEIIKREDLERYEEDRAKRETLRKDLKEQIQETRRVLTESLIEETKIERTKAEQINLELAMEKSHRAKSVQILRKELLAYMNRLDELRTEECRRDAELDAIIEQSRKDEQAKKDLARRKIREAKSALLKEVLDARKDQLRRKEEALKVEMEEERMEKEELRREIEEFERQETLKKREGMERAKEYANCLKSQQNYLDNLKKKEKEEEDRIFKEYEKEQKMDVQELVEVSFHTHPFKAFLEQ